VKLKPGAAGEVLPSRVFARLLEALLQRNTWALERLRPFAERTARVGVGSLALGIQIGADGGLLAAPVPENPAVQIDLPGDVWTRLPAGPQAVFGELRIAGDAAFAEALGFVLRNLRWDAEEDLAKVLGDPLAHRVHSTAVTAAAWMRQTADKFRANLHEYAVEEAQLTPSRDELSQFSGDIAELRDTLDRLALRVDKLKRY